MYQGVNLDIHFTSMLVGDGYLWLMENLTTNMALDSTFVFDLNNLRIVSSLKGQGGTGHCELNVSLKPGENRILRFILIDPMFAWGYSYSYSYSCSEMIESEEALASMVKEKGVLKIVNYQALETPARYWVHFVNESYVFVFENLTTATLSNG